MPNFNKENRSFLKGTTLYGPLKKYGKPLKMYGKPLKMHGKPLKKMDDMYDGKPGIQKADFAQFSTPAKKYAPGQAAAIYAQKADDAKKKKRKA